MRDEVETPEEVEEMRGPWATERDRREALLKRVAVKWVEPEKRGRKASLTLTGPREALAMFEIVTLQVMGDVAFFAIGTKKVSKLQIKWGDYTVPYPTKPGQNSIGDYFKE